MQKRHLDRYQYFKEQAYTTEKYVIPYLSDFGEIDSESRILEIGCGEGGNLKPFVEMGCEVVGVDISERKIDLAESYLGEDGNYTLFLEDIYQTNSSELGVFDVIMMRDVIEHIPDQERFMRFVKQFLHSDSLFFWGFLRGKCLLADISRFVAISYYPDCPTITCYLNIYMPMFYNGVGRVRRASKVCSGRKEPGFQLKDLKKL